jgi:hypothetical protein
LIVGKNLLKVSRKISIKTLPPIPQKTIIKNNVISPVKQHPQLLRDKKDPQSLRNPPKAPGINQADS